MIPSHTRVVACTGGAATRIEQRTLRPPAKGEIVLALSAVGLCGTDLFKLDTASAAPGTVLGHELVGVVAATGEQVEAFSIGERVAVPHHVPCGQCAKCRRGADTLCEQFRVNLMEPGGFADYVIIQSRAVGCAARRIPSHLSNDVAVWMEPAACVLRSIDRAELPPQGLAVVLGAGSMGLLHLLVLRACSAQRPVVVVDHDRARLRIASQLGARHAFEPAELSAGVTALTDGLGADAVFDTVGGAEVLKTALTVSREGGTVVLFAHAKNGEQAAFELNELFKYERRIIGTYSGTPKEQARVFELMVNGRLDPSPLITHRLDLSQFQQGCDLVRARKAIKVVFENQQGGGA